MASVVDLAMLKTIMGDMAKSGKIFSNEREFQIELAERLQKKLSNRISFIMLECLTLHKDGDRRTDIVIGQPNGEHIAIELKYKTDVLVCHDKKLSLKPQAAQDLARYDYFADLERNEQLLNQNNTVLNLNYVKGFCIFLTNEKVYWTDTSRKNVMYNNFKLVPNSNNVVKISKGNKNWLNNPSAKSVGVQRMSAITLTQDYDGQWEDYKPCEACGKCKEKNKEFKYLILETK